ncbi:MAG: acyltransferase [Bacteroidetes bacterium]|nr:MAG: acyltransferase [Bacteroidota bacterium]
MNRLQHIDFIRIIACLMVLFAHTGELFYITPTGGVAENFTDFVNIYGSFFRVPVPIFVVISGYLLLPSKESQGVFYKKRFGRIVFPFLFWSFVYVLVSFLKNEYSSSQALVRAASIFVNFNWNSGHLWFVYMLLGLYLFIPVISPWASLADKSQKEFFLIIWGITLFFPYIRTQIPNLLGEEFWNEFSTTYYFSGFIGYLLLGNYIKEHLKMNLKRDFLLGSTCILLGYAITFLVFKNQMTFAKTLIVLELSWRFNSINIALMVFGLFIMARHFQISSVFVSKWITDISAFTYGIYIIHILVLGETFKILKQITPNPAILIILNGFFAFIICYFLLKIISFLPKSKYITG